jgi:hypothetical protein
METTVKTSKKVISDKSVQAQKLIANAKAAETIAQINATIEEIPQVSPEEDKLILQDLNEAENIMQLRTIAQKYPVFKDLLPTLNDYKHFIALWETLQGFIEPKLKAKKVKAPKPPKVPIPSAYGTAVDIMCKNPALTFQDLKTQLASAGFSKDSAARTAQVTVHKVYNLLKINGFVK